MYARFCGVDWPRIPIIGPFRSAIWWPLAIIFEQNWNTEKLKKMNESCRKVPKMIIGINC